MGSQDPGEPLTYDPEVCLVTSRECLQGQIPVLRGQPWVPGPQAQLQLWVRPGVGLCRVGQGCSSRSEAAAGWVDPEARQGALGEQVWDGGMSER